MKQRNLTQGSILRNIINFSLPYMLAYLLQIVYGLADLFVIGLYCNVESTTAVANGAQVMYFVTVVIIGLAMGTTVCTAHAIGANDRDRKALVVGNTLTLFALLSIVLTAVLLLLVPSIVGWMLVPSEAVADTHRYLRVCFSGIPFIVAYNVIASIFRGMGDTRTPLQFVAVACVVNVVLDFLFIGTLHLGAMGAALATTLSQAVSVVYALQVVRRHREAFGIERSHFRLQREVVRGMGKIGVPIALQDAFIQISFIVIAVIANNRGLDDAAAVGIVEKFIGLLFIIPSAMLSTVSAISAQCIGGGLRQRARQTMYAAIAITFSFGLLWSIMLQFNSEWPVRFFTDNAHVMQLGGEYLRSYVWDCALAGIHFCFSGFFTACGYSIISFAHNVVSIVTARVPLSYIFSVSYPLTLYPMGWAAPIGSAISVVICVVAYRVLRRRFASRPSQF